MIATSGLLLVAMFLLLGLGYAFRIDAIRIQEVEVIGSNVVPKEDLLAYISESLKGTYWYVVPRNNAFFYPEDEIKKGLAERFAILHDITIKRVSLNKVMADVSERETFALACSGAPGSDISLIEGCFAVDEKGLIFAEAPKFSARVYTRFFNQKEGFELKTGVNFTDAETLKSLQSISNMLLAKGYTVNGMILADDGSYETHVKGRTDRETVVFFDARDHKEGLAKVERNLALFLDEKKKMITKDMNEFEYIDARYGNSIYFKLYGAEREAQENESL